MSDTFFDESIGVPAPPFREQEEAEGTGVPRVVTPPIRQTREQLREQPELDGLPPQRETVSQAELIRARQLRQLRRSALRFPIKPLPRTEETTNTDELVDFAGRLGSASAQGFERGFGEGAFGLSTANRQLLSDLGILPRNDGSALDGIRQFNASLIDPLSVGIDITLRGMSGLGQGGLELFGQLEYERTGDAGFARRQTRSAFTMQLISPAIIQGQAINAQVQLNAAIARRHLKNQIEQPFGKTEPQPGQAPVTENTGVLSPIKRRPDNLKEEDFAGNINLDTITDDESVRQLMRDVAEANGGFSEQTRGVQTMAAIEAKAIELAQNPTDLLNRGIGAAFTPEETYAHSIIMAKIGARVDRIGERLIQGDTSEATVNSYLEALAQHELVQGVVAGSGAEFGRTGAVRSALAEQNRRARGVQDIIEENRNVDPVVIAKTIKELETPQQRSKFFTTYQRVRNAIIEYRTNALLSSTETHGVNVTSNMAFALESLVTETVAGVIGSGRRAFGAKDTARIENAADRLYGTIQGAREGFTVGYKIFRDDIYDDASKLEQNRLRAQPGDFTRALNRVARQQAKQEGLRGQARTDRVNELVANPSEELTARATEAANRSQFEAIPGPVGTAVRLPGRALRAQDGFFRTIGYRQELHVLALRQARREGLSGPRLRDRVNQLVSDPPDSMHKKAREIGQRQTFTNPLGDFGNQVIALINAEPTGIGRVVAPFIRAPTNIVKQAGERTPLAPFLSARIRNNILQGGLEADRAIARIAMGSSLGLAAFMAAENNMITGSGVITGNTSQRARQEAVLRKNGWQPYSIRVGDTWVAYNSLEPFGTIMGLAADMSSLKNAIRKDEIDNVGGAVIGIGSDNLISKTWARGASDFSALWHDGNRYAESWTQQLIASFVPAGVAQVNRSFFDQRLSFESDTILEAVKARVPGLSQDVISQRDIFGELITGDGFNVARFYQSQIENDPVVNSLIENRVWPARIGNTILDVELTPQEHDVLEQIAGRMLYERLQHAIVSEDYLNASPYQRYTGLTRIINQSRDDARASFAEAFPETAQRILDEREARIGEGLELDLEQDNNQ